MAPRSMCVFVCAFVCLFTAFPRLAAHICAAAGACHPCTLSAPSHATLLRDIMTMEQELRTLPKLERLVVGGNQLVLQYLRMYTFTHSIHAERASVRERVCAPVCRCACGSAAEFSKNLVLRARTQKEKRSPYPSHRPHFLPTPSWPILRILRELGGRFRSGHRIGIDTCRRQETPALTTTHNMHRHP